MRLAVLACAVAAAVATTPLHAADFSPGAVVMTPEQITAHLAKRSYLLTMSEGIASRLTYKANGYFFYSSSQGDGKGRWLVEHGRVCMMCLTRICNDVRLHDGVMEMKRENGEILRLVPG